MMQAIADYLCGEGAPLLGNDRGVGRIHLLKASGARGIAARVNFFVFCGKERHPRLVCRVARHVSGEERLRREWMLRHRMAAQLPAPLRATVPRPLALESILGALVLLEQVVPGTTLRGATTRRFGWARKKRVRWELEAASRWILAFQEATESDRRAWTARDEEEHVLQSFAKAARWIRPDLRRGLAEDLRWRMRALRDHEVSWPVQHGDLWHGNMVRRAREIAVVDWEVAQATGPAFVDPLTFAFQYLFWNTDARVSESWSTSRPRWLRASVHRFIRQTLGRLADDAAQLDAAFLVSLLARSRLAQPEEGPPIALRVLIAALRAPQTLGWLRGA